jgi:hypothetical protein
MSVTSCPDCNGKVSDSAMACPHCGKPVKAIAAPPAAQPPQSGGGFLDPKANAKSAKGILVTVFVLIGIIVTVWFVFARSTGAKTAPMVNVLTGKPPIILDDKFTVNQNYVMNHKLNIERAPGMLTGNFYARGKTIGIKGAQDDTLVGFHILGPNSQKLNVLDHPVRGNFSLRVTAPGTYTLVFDNGGIIRSTPREVTLEGKYQPE